MLTADAIRAGRAGLLPGLLEAAEVREPTHDGYRARFAPTSEMLAAVARTIDAERQCCRFLRFTLRIEADGGPFWLDISGPDGTRAFLEALLTA